MGASCFKPSVSEEYGGGGAGLHGQLGYGSGGGGLHGQIQQGLQQQQPQHMPMAQHHQQQPPPPPPPPRYAGPLLRSPPGCDSAWCKLQFDAGNVLSVYGAAFTIGRLQSNHLVVEDARLSSTHCCLAPARESGKPPILTDTSTNGTFVAGEKLHKSSRQLKWGERVEVVQGNTNLCFVVNRQEKSESSECRKMETVLPATMQRTCLQQAPMQDQRGGGDGSDVFKGPSRVDMWSDPNPPTVSQIDWTTVKDGLYNKGNFLRSLGGHDNDNARHVGEKAYRASLALNLMQEDYKRRLFTVGGQGRILLERALGVFTHQHCAEGDTPDIKIKPMKKRKNLASQEVVAACDKLRKYGNRAVHSADLRPDEKPDVIKNAFIVAQALLLKVELMEQERGRRGPRGGPGLYPVVT